MAHTFGRRPQDVRGTWFDGCAVYTVDGIAKMEMTHEDGHGGMDIDGHGGMDIDRHGVVVVGYRE